MLTKVHIIFQSIQIRTGKAYWHIVLFTTSVNHISFQPIQMYSTISQVTNGRIALFTVRNAVCKHNEQLFASVC